MKTETIMTDLTKRLATLFFRDCFQAKHAMTRAHTHLSRATLHGVVQGLQRAVGMMAEDIEGELTDPLIAGLEELNAEIEAQEGRKHPLKARYVEQLPDEIGGLDLTDIKRALHRHEDGK